MADLLIALMVGFLAALAVVVTIRVLRGRAGRRASPAPEAPVSRQHRRAIERRANK